MKFNIRTKKTVGFTLVEILVTVAILAILGTVTVMMVSGVNKKAKISQAKSQMTMLSSAIEAFKDATGKYPLAVPYDAWGANWSDFIDKADDFEWDEYFVGDAGTPNQPAFQWETNETPTVEPTPTNIQMLTFQLSQEPSANAILSRIRENTADREQIKMSLTATFEEDWQTASDLCKLRHPLNPTLLWDDTPSTFQPLDPWGTPYRYWNATTLKWAKENAVKTQWDNLASTGRPITELLAEKLQAANWGFILESAGPDGKFGWVGDSQSQLNVQQAEDNIYSID